MITAPAYQGKKVGVFGLARSGLSAVHSLVASGAQVYAWDDNEPARAKVQSCAVDLYEMDFDELDELVLAPGVPLTHPEPHPVVQKAKAAGVSITCDLEVFEAARASLPAHKVVGITGTNGKSTTTALIGHILAEAGRPVAVGGNIGTGVLALDALPAGGIYVFELSSFQLDLCHTLRCDVGALLNITPDHLDRHGSMEAYAAAKKRLFDLQAATDVAVIGIDDDYCRTIAGEKSGAVEVSTQSTPESGFSAAGGILCSSEGEMIGSLEGVSSLQGQHNWQNAGVAFACCRALGLDDDVILDAIHSFPGLAHRQQVLAVDADFTVVNDSKATNVDAACRALKTFDRIRWIAGGRAKDKDFSALADAMQSVRKAYLMGEHAELIAGALPNSLNASRHETMFEALESALEEAEAGDTILLSPACTAFDQFANFEQRGEAFSSAIFSAVGARQ